MCWMPGSQYEKFQRDPPHKYNYESGIGNSIYKEAWATGAVPWAHIPISGRTGSRIVRFVNLNKLASSFFVNSDP
jgi:hypothetical protein